VVLSDNVKDDHIAASSGGRDMQMPAYIELPQTRMAPALLDSLLRTCSAAEEPLGLEVDGRLVLLNATARRRNGSVQYDAVPVLDHAGNVVADLKLARS
jgi:hypothetical protein